MSARLVDVLQLQAMTSPGDRLLKEDTSVASPDPSRLVITRSGALGSPYVGGTLLTLLGMLSPPPFWFDWLPMQQETKCAQSSPVGLVGTGVNAPRRLSVDPSVQNHPSLHTKPA